MSSIVLKTKELFTYCCDCHGNQVTIVMNYVTNFLVLRKFHAKYGPQKDPRQKSYLHKTVVAMVTKLP